MAKITSLWKSRKRFLEGVGIEFAQCLWLGYEYMEMVMMVTIG